MTNKKNSHDRKPPVRTVGADVATAVMTDPENRVTTDGHD